MKKRHWYWNHWSLRFKVYPPTPNGSRYVEFAIGPYWRSFWLPPTKERDE